MITLLKTGKRLVANFLADLEAGWTPAQKSRVVMYHGVDSKNSLDHNIRHIGQFYFEKHIRLLMKKYKVVAVKDYFENYKNDSRLCCITFDDGYRNNLSHALPILTKYQSPATIFVTTIQQKGQDFLWSDMLDLIVPMLGEELVFNDVVYRRKKGRWYKPFYSQEGANFHNVFKLSGFQQKCEFFTEFDHLVQRVKNNPSLDDYWNLLSPNQIKKISESGFVEIGSHAVSHQNLNTLRMKEAINEMSHSKRYLSNLIGKEVETLAYPDGAYSIELVAEAMKLGYNYQFAVEYLESADKYDDHILDRKGLYSYQSLRQQYQTILK